MPVRSSSPMSWTAISNLLPKSFFSELVPDIGTDGEIRGKGSIFARKLIESKYLAQNLTNFVGKIDYDCKHCHENSCWNFAFEKLDICSPQFFKTYLIIHLIPFLLFKRKLLRKEPLKCLKKFLKGYGKSMFFILWYCYFGTRSMCALKNFKNLKYSRKLLQKYGFLTPYKL